jgi:hypothetical protein
MEPHTDSGTTDTPDVVAPDRAHKVRDHFFRGTLTDRLYQMLPLNMQKAYVALHRYRPMTDDEVRGTTRAETKKKNAKKAEKQARKGARRK